MAVSILHRVTGDGMALVGLAVLLWWLGALAGGYLGAGIPFNWKDLTPVAMLALDEFVLWVNAEKPYKNVKEFVAALKRVADAARKHGKAAGILVHSAALVPMLKDLGYTFMALGSDGGAARAGLLGFAGALKGK